MSSTMMATTSWTTRTRPRSTRTSSRTTRPTTRRRGSMTLSNPGEQPAATQANAAATPSDPGEPDAGSNAQRQRVPPSRLAPETLAAARQDGALEGLAWLGREPEAKASLTYRFLRLVARALLFGVFRFHISTSGQELLPSGGYPLTAGGHPGRVGPLVAMAAHPPQ